MDARVESMQSEPIVHARSLQSRRALLTGAIGGLAAWAAAAVSDAAPARAIDPNDVVLGAVNTASSTTKVRNPSTTDPALWGAGASAVGVVGTSVGSTGVSGHSEDFYGVHGFSGSSAGVYGVSNDATGVEGHSGNGVGCRRIATSTRPSAHLPRKARPRSTPSTGILGSPIPLSLVSATCRARA